MMDLRAAGLDTVYVKTDRLLAKVKENRETHREKFEEAMEGYKARSIQLLEEHIERIKSNAPERVAVNLPFPTDHTSDYDRVIEQLEWSLDEEILLTDHDFNTYVRDEWGWQKDFTETYAMYSSTT